MRGAHQPINFHSPKAAVSERTHALMTGFAEDLLNPTSCTAPRVQRRWTACTLICVRASIASTDKTVLTVAAIISLLLPFQLQHQPTTSTQSSALETAYTATDSFYRIFLGDVSDTTLHQKCQASAICGYQPAVKVRGSHRQLGRARPRVTWHRKAQIPVKSLSQLPM